MHPWHDLDPGPAAPTVVNVVVEIPKGSRHKYEIDKPSGLFKLDRVLYSAVHYPGDYGIVPRSYYDDGDPFDVLIVGNLPTFTGCIVEARPVALFRMRDKGLPDDKVLAVSHRDPSFAEVRRKDDLPPHLYLEIEHFFRVYKDLEGGRVETHGWADVDEAHQKIRYAIGLYREKFAQRPA
jgi:inorganic pyrophosphatase